ncbi:putative DNA-sulfur modification-associated protein [Psychrobacillus phage Perkons]|nr:putative DNA-sulfur modification-associated protein [Psychrobacillus phage Perkons]
MLDRKGLEELLVIDIKKIKKKRKVIDEIKVYLAHEYGILAGTIQEVTNNPNEHLPNLEIRELYLITEQVFSKTGDININPDLFFTDVEKREAKLYEASIYRDEIDLPQVFQPAIKLGDDSYTVKIDVKLLNKMLDAQLLHYDPELQREMKAINDGKGGIRYVPTIVEKNVDMIADSMLKGSLEHTNLVWNAMLGSGDDGEELIYDEKTLTLTILKGTKLAIVDGFHRHKGAQQALRQNPNIEFNFALNITNYNKKRAQGYQAQLAEATQISKNRKAQLKEERYSDGIVTRLMSESDLENRVSQDFKLKTSANQLVAYNVLADSIDKYFKTVSKRDANNVGNFLIEFFDELLGSYSDEFITNVKESKKVSLMNHNNMFVGYIVLASRMFQSQIPISELNNILSKINFNKDNEMWEELGVLNSKGNIEDTSKVRKLIADYFSELEISERKMLDESK